MTQPRFAAVMRNLGSKNILVVEELSWPAGGGGTLASHLIVKLLSKTKELNVTLVTGTRHPTKIEKVSCVFAPLLRTRNKIELWKNALILSRQKWFVRLVASSDFVYIPRYCYPVIDLAKNLNKTVIVHLHDFQPISYGAVFAETLPKRGVPAAVKFEVLERHGILRALECGFLAPVNRLSRFWISKADNVICVSRRQAQIIAEHAPELIGKHTVIYNPLPDLPLLDKIPTSPPSMLYLGGDSYFKGFYPFLRASLENLRRGRKAHFFVAGPLRNFAFNILAHMNHVSNNSYTALGWVKHDEILELSRLSHAILFPSLIEETFGYAVVESMLSGTIPIASSIGAIPEILHDTYAESTIFHPGSADQLAERIERVMSLSREELAEIGASLRNAVLNKFDENDTRRKLIRVFQ